MKSKAIAFVGGLLIVWCLVVTALLVQDDQMVSRLNVRIDSIVESHAAWIQRQPPRNLRLERDSIVMQAALEIGVPPELALAVAWVENPRADSAAVSRAGAVGLMQVMPPEALMARGDTAGALARALYIADVCGASYSLTVRSCNVQVGLHLYADFLQQFGTEARALAAYNGALNYPVAAQRYVRAVRNYAQALAVVGTVRGLTQ